MTDITKQIEKIEEEIRKTPYHKATEHHIGKLRAKLSKLKELQSEKTSKKSSGGIGYAVKKQGDATITLVGNPSVGKSSLLNKLTNAKSKIAQYAFTTVTVVPGMMEYKDAKIQILDVPGLIKGAEVGKGRGKEVLSVIRGSDLIIIICDIKNISSLKKITESLENSGIRINKNPAKVIVEKKVKGGLIIHSNIKQNISPDVIKDIAQEFGIRNAEITVKEKLTIERLIDVFSRNRSYIKAIFVVNKIDLKKTFKKDKNIFYISVEKNLNIDKLKEIILQKLELIRVYLVKRDEEPSFENPVIMSKGQNLIELAEKIGDEFAQDKSEAKIWGKDAKYDGQVVSLSKPLADGMQIRFI